MKPGERWEVHESIDNIVVNSNTNHVVAQVYDADNSKLIAALPDLVEALRLIASSDSSVAYLAADALRKAGL